MQMVKGDSAIVLNGDTFFDVDLNGLSALCSKNPEAQLTMALKPMQHFDRYGTVATDNAGRILEFREKRPCDEGLINGGVYWLRNTPDNLPQSLFYQLSGKFSFETEVLAKHYGATGCLFGLVQEGYFIDIGIPEDYRRAEQELPKMFEQI